MFLNRMSKFMALRYARALTPPEDNPFDSAEANLEAGAQHCLRFLASTIGNGAETVANSDRMSALRPPYVEQNLGDRLREMMEELCASGHDWRWELDDEMTASVERIFIISGGSRTRVPPTDTKILHITPLGQQYVMGQERMHTFMTAGISEKLEIFEELQMTDMVLVADVSVKAQQRWAFREGGKSEEGLLLKSETVEHVLRLEMSMPQSSEASPSKRVSSWQLADWNWLCGGNHPSLKKGKKAPW